MINTNTHHLLTLRKIASWQIPGIENGDSEIIAGIPSLQRGAVWEPQQIEMLWDSIMRGFPIGSIVIAKKINNQSNKHQITLAIDSVLSAETSHHILDGQQRCNAIAWGFVNPWEDKLSDDVVLWLDLKPDARLIKNTTRKYLFRVTTMAHPWGFHHGDQTGNLSTSDIEKFKEKLPAYHQPEKWPEKFHAELVSGQNLQNGKIKRPSPKLAIPYDAGFPIPMFLLFKYFNDGKLNWEMLAQDEWIKIISTWSGLSILSLDNGNRKHIESGLIIAEQACMVALQVPDLINGIDDIEQIFQRLNRQGTPLDNEELAYSLIKAYWTDVEETISKLPHHTTEARLVGMGVRVALTEPDSDKLVPEQSVDRIRNIFRPNVNKAKEDIKAQQQIESFFKKGELEKTLKWIDEQFLYNENSRDYGLPAYLRSSLAWTSRDVFAWLMLLAKRFNYEIINDPVLIKKIIGLALTIHWFGEEKTKAVDMLVKRHGDIKTVTISELNADDKRVSIRVPLNHEELGKAFQLDEKSSDTQLENWVDFWQGVVNINADGSNNRDVEVTKSRANNYGFFINKLRNQKELLVYAQRGYVEKVFDGFDPSNKLMWKGHNRPWDYDHILPSQNLNAQGKGTKKYLKICQAWQQSIGNQVAVDFSFNRAAQHTVNASEKYDQFAKENKFQIFSNNLQGFIMELEDADDAEKSKKFVLAVKNRFIALYETWYKSFEIENYRNL